MRILVIGADDDRVAWVEWTLLDEDVDLCLVSHGEEGIARTKPAAFELIILDPHLPDLSGPGILKRFAQGGVRAPVMPAPETASRDQGCGRCSPNQAIVADITWLNAGSAYTS